MKSDFHPIKITRPALSGVYQRKRLFKLVDNKTKNSALWIAGPAGAGKTTLVNSYVTAKKLNCIWYQIDDRDSDVASFFHYMGIASAKNSPRAKKPLPYFTPEYTLGLSAFTKQFFQEFFSRVKLPFALVIDNWHEIPEDSRILTALSDMIGQAPQGARIILTSRNDPPPALARLLANRTLVELDQGELQLNQTEISGISKIYGVKITGKANIDKLVSTSKGWTAGIILMLEGIKTGRLGMENLKDSAIDAVFNYFMTEIFEKIDNATKNFLLKTSLLPRDINVTAARVISHNNEAGAMLKKLCEQHFFIDRMQSAKPAYQYHPLFREFLAQRAALVFTKEQIRSMLIDAAASFEDNGLAEEAASMYIAIGEHEPLSRLILENAQTFISQGRFKIIETWTSTLPQETLASRPWLLFYSGISRLFMQPTLARVNLEAAYAKFARENSASGEMLSWAGIVNSHIYAMNDFHPLDDWIDRHEAMIKKYNGYPGDKVREAVTSAMFSALMFRRPDHPDIQKWAENAEAVMRSTQDKTLKVNIGNNLVMFWLRTCHVSRAGIITDLLREESISAGVSDMQKLGWYRAITLYKFYVSSSRESLEYCKKGLDLARTSGIHIYNSMLLGLGVYNGVAYADLKSANEYLSNMSAMQDSPRAFDVMYYHHMASLVAAHQERLSDALEHARKCLEISESVGFQFQHFIQVYCYTYILAKTGQYDRIKVLIDEMHQFSVRTRSALYDWACYFLEAFIDMKKGDDEAFFEHLGAAINIVKERGIKVMAFFTPAESIQILAKALEADFETAYIKDLASVHEYVPAEPMPWLEAWPWPVKIKTLGNFEIFINGERIQFPRKVKQKPIELLKVLLASGKDGISEEVVSDILWPDAEGDLAKSNFFTTLHRLRTLLGCEAAIKLSGHMIGIDHRYCWVDTEAFEYFIQGSQTELNAMNLSEIMSFTGRICALYKGLFLAADKNPFLVSRRERLNIKFVHLLEKVGKAYEHLGEVDKAIDVYTTGIETDLLAEAFYQRLMKCYARAGRNAEAMKTYNRCKRALSTHLNVDPSQETENIRKSIQNS